MDTWELLLALSLGAGVLGTGIGGALGVLFAGKGERTMGQVLSFAAGVMLGVSLIDMLPEAAEGFSSMGRYGALLAVAACAFGALIVEALEKLVEFWGRRQGASAGTLGVIEIFGTASADRRRMLRAGAVMALAIALHNIPEGMAIGSAGVRELSLGVTVALLLAVHNIPEGMAISAPLKGGGLKSFAAIGLSVLAGSSTAIGALIGVQLGALGGVASGACLAISAGAMLCVSCADILPETVSLAGKLPSLGLFAGILCAACFAFSR